MKRTNIVMSGLALASLVMAGLPGQVLAQSSPQRSYDNLVNKDNLLVTMEESADRALLGGKSVFRGKVKNQGNAPLYNVGWTAELPQGVNFKGVKAGPGDFGSPKVTILIWNDGRTTTLVHWNNVADLSPGAEAWFEIEVDNNAPKKGTQPPKEGKYFVPGESFEAKVWASGSQNELVLPAFGEYGVAGGPIEQENQGSRVWASDRQKVQVEGVIATMAMSDIVNGVALRGNKQNQRQMVTVELERTKYGDVTLNKSVTIDLDPVWEIMGTCVKGGENCFTPTDANLRWEANKWKLDIPAEKFVFNGEHKAKVTFEIAALDHDNVAPAPGQPKVNKAGLGGDGKQGGARDDVARLDPAYANNTGKASQNATAKIDGAVMVNYRHPWNQTDAMKYPNHDNVPIDLPEISTRIEDTSVSLTTAMVGGGPYKNEALADKTLVIRTNEYTPMASDRQVVITLSEPECPVAKDTENCIESGPIKITRTVVTSEGTQTNTTVQGTVKKESNGKYTVTIPADGIDPDTSRTQTFEFKSKVLSQANGKYVVNGKPLETDAHLERTYPSGKVTIGTKASLPPAPLEVFNTVAFPLNGTGACPAATTTMPTADEKKALKDHANENRLLGDLDGQADEWGKRRKVGTGDELCFQVFTQFPDGIVTKQPTLDIFLPPKAELIADPQLAGSIANQIALQQSSKEDSATKPVAKPELRSPLKYQFNGDVQGGSTVSFVYKAKIKNASVVDPAKPEVIYDNLAKLSYQDFDGGYSNARDLAGYEFVNPLVILKANKTAEKIQRGATSRITYTVASVGNGPVGPGTKVVIKLPERTTCTDVTIGGGATKESCHEGNNPNPATNLLTGGFLIASVTDVIAAKDDTSTNDEKTFTLDFKANNGHTPTTEYEVEAGILGYKGLTSNPGDPNAPIYVPKENAFCQPLASHDEASDNACTADIAEKVYLKSTPYDLLGKTLFPAANKAPGGLSTNTKTIFTTGDAALTLAGTSADQNQKGDHQKTLVPGEKGSISFTLSPNPSADQGSTPPMLTGYALDANTKLVMQVIGVDARTPAKFLKDQQEIKNALTTAFGPALDAGKISITNNSQENGTSTISAELQQWPGTPKTVDLTDLFVASKNPVRVTVTLTYKGLTLKHKDSQTAQIGQSPAPTVQPKTATAPQVIYARKIPDLAVTKSVTRPQVNWISGRSEIDYKIVITNTSDVMAYDVNLTDTLPDEFTHRANLTDVQVNNVTITDQGNKLNWQLTEAQKKGQWPTAELLRIPSGGSVTLSYTAEAPGVVTAAQAYTNRVQVPWASQPNNPLGNLTGNQQGEATVQGNAIVSATTVERQHDRHGFTDGAIQHGDVVRTTTRITIPGRVKVPNLSVLTNLSGATIDRTNAQVQVTCPPSSGLTCDSLNLLTGSPTELGVNLKNGEFENNTDDPITVDVTVSNLLVTDGNGLVTAKGDAYIGATFPSNVGELKGMTRASDGSTGEVPIKSPALQVMTELLEGAGKTPVNAPIEPGTELTARVTLTNTGDGSKLYNTSVTEIINQLAAAGLTPTTAFNQADLSNRTVVHGTPVVIEIPLTWTKDKFTGPGKLTTPQQVQATGTGQTGPLNVIPDASAPETIGSTVTNNGSASFTPVYPQPQVSATVTKIGGEPLSNTVPPQLAVGKEGVVTFTPNINGGQGFNPLLCVKVENLAPHAADAKGLTLGALHEPAQGVSIAKPNTVCADGEVEVNLPTPNPGEALPSVSFKITNSGTPISDKLPTQITATLRVDSRIEKGDDTPGARSYTTSTTQQVDVVPSVDIKVTSQWFKPSGEPFGDGDQVVYNDYDTETVPVKAKISIQNIGSDAATPQGSTVKVKIPTGFTIDGNANTDGWACQVETQTDETLLNCTRNEELPGNQQTPFEVTIKSLSGPGVRLTTNNPLAIRGGYPDNLAANSPFDPFLENHTVNTQAKVNTPKPDFAPVIEIVDRFRREGKDVKPFTVEVTHSGDMVRAHELKVHIDGNGDSPTFGVKNPNGWHCTDNAYFVVCTWPQAITRDSGKLSKIELTTNMENIAGTGKIRAKTEWHRPSQTGSSMPTVVTVDSDPYNDTTKATFTPFSEWVDADVNVSFESPTPNTGEDPKPKVIISHVDGGKDIPAGTKVQVTVPPNTRVQDNANVADCVLKTDNGTAVTYACELVKTLAPGNKVQGPTITGVAGPGQKIAAKVVLDADPKQSNNGHSAVSGSKDVDKYPDLKVEARWLGPKGKPLKNPVSFNDYYTENRPVRARITITNIGSTSIPAEQATVKLIIPEGFTIDEQRNQDGWSCNISNISLNSELICTREQPLPGVQKRSFMVIIKSASGPGIRLPEGGIFIKGGFANHRAAIVQKDGHVKNDTVDLKAGVRVPKLDIWPVIVTPHPFIREQDTQKHFQIDVHHVGDRLRKHEATVVLFSDKGTLPIEVTNANGWSCAPKSTNVICRYPLISQSGQQRLPRIEAAIDASLNDAPFNLGAQTIWLRSGRDGGVVPTTDVNMANDLSELTIQKVPEEG